ncbi:MAG TPA: AI-2E family transporter [Candidatus Acidoferrales bacterium]|nr:AI-2E family transporter [Candidatus Acidoferrales bacterium]
MKLFDKKTAQALMTILVFGLILLFLYVAWRALITFLFAIFFAYILEAPVSKLQGWLKGSRPAAIALVYLLFAGLMVLTLSLLGPPVMDEAQKLMQQAPELEAKFSSGALLQQLGARHGWNGAITEWINHYLDNHRGEVIGATQNFVVRAVKSIQNMWWLLLVPILAIFFLRDGHQLSQNVINSVEDNRNRRMVAETVQEMDSMLGHFIRAQLTLAGLAMAALTFGLWIMRVPYAFALGPAAGALEFIPVVGPAIGGLMVLGVALLSGYGHFWWLLVFLLVWRCVQDYVTSPRIVGTTLELHPLTVLFGVFAGGEVAGVIGVFLSIPVLATLRILWHTWLLYRKTGQKSAA